MDWSIIGIAAAALARIIDALTAKSDDVPASVERLRAVLAAEQAELDGLGDKLANRDQVDYEREPVSTR